MRNFSHTGEWLLASSPERSGGFLGFIWCSYSQIISILISSHPEILITYHTPPGIASLTSHVSPSLVKTHGGASHEYVNITCESFRWKVLSVCVWPHSKRPRGPSKRPGEGSFWQDFCFLFIEWKRNSPSGLRTKRLNAHQSTFHSTIILIEPISFWQCKDARHCVPNIACFTFPCKDARRCVSWIR
jgi:hypothetical protein